MSTAPPFAALALLPADDEPGDAVVASRPTSRSGSALRHAARREIDLWRLRGGLPAPLTVRAVHRLGARGVAPGLRGRARSALRGGVLVEIARPDAGPRVLDAIAAAAGVRLDGALHAGAGDTLVVPVRLADGTRGVLRAGPAGAPGDPARVAATLERLAGAGVPVAAPLRAGTVGGASWTLEPALPGRRPAGLTGPLLDDVAEACARLPRTAGPPRAPLDDLRAAAARLPGHAAALEALARQLEPRLAALPAVTRHGDLWTGNLLADRGRLTGIVDWDAAHPAGVPGADLVQLVGTEWRRRHRQPLGAAVLTRSWATDHVPADAEALDLTVVAWWASEVHHTLRRFPQRAADTGWLAANVAAVLSPRGGAPSGRSRAGARRSTPRAATRG